MLQLYHAHGASSNKATKKSSQIFDICDIIDWFSSNQMKTVPLFLLLIQELSVSAAFLMEITKLCFVCFVFSDAQQDHSS